MERIDQLEADARAARDSAAWNLEMAQERLDPANWFRPLREAGGTATRTVERLAREHPAALATGAIGLVALLAAGMRPRRRSKASGWKPTRAMGEAADDVRTKTSHAAADVRHAASEAARRAGDAAHIARDKASDAAHAAGQYAQDLAKAAAQRAEAALRTARESADALGGRARSGARWAAHEAEEHPGATIAVGLAVGAALALLLRGDDAMRA
jgi:ElaB/YqjD/DUF883 family membrane-anchored ribosome-binding protein